MDAVMPTIELSFETKEAADALTELAKLTLQRPELARGIASIGEPLFDSFTREGDLDRSTRTRRIVFVITPSQAFRKFLQAIEGLPAIHRPRE